MVFVGLLTKLTDWLRSRGYGGGAPRRAGRRPCGTAKGGRGSDRTVRPAGASGVLGPHETSGWPWSGAWVSQARAAAVPVGVDRGTGHLVQELAGPAAGAPAAQAQRLDQPGPVLGGLLRRKAGGVGFSAAPDLAGQPVAVDDVAAEDLFGLREALCGPVRVDLRPVRCHDHSRGHRRLLGPGGALGPRDRDPASAGGMAGGSALRPLGRGDRRLRGPVHAVRQPGLLLGHVRGVLDRILELPEVQRLFELSKNFSHERTTWSRGGAFRLKRVTHVRRQVWPDEDDPEFESFAYVTFEPYKRATGLETDSLGEAVDARGVSSKFPFLTYHAEPDGDAWDFGDEAEFIRRLPRLARHYGLT